MYYEERVIDGIMHWRTDPEREFEPMDAKQLTALLVRERADHKQAILQLEGV